MRKIPSLNRFAATLCFALIFIANTLSGQDSRWVYKWSGHSALIETDLELLRSTEQFNGHNYFIVQTGKIPGAAARNTMKNDGIELLGYLGNDHYWARIKSNRINQAFLGNHDIRSLAIPGQELKRNPVTEKLLEAGNVEEFAIRVWHEDDLVALGEWLLHLPGLEITGMKMNRRLLTVHMNGSSLDAVQHHPAVAFVGPHATSGGQLIDDGISMVKVNPLQNTSMFGEGLSGAGVRVGMWDDGLTGNHVDINPSVTNVEKTYFGSIPSMHPTHVASLITGKGHKLNRIRGMAPDSRVFAWSFTGDIIDEMNEGISDYGLNIINSSFFINEYNDPITETMCVFPAFYVLESSEIDQMVRDNPKLTHVIANGNQNVDCQNAGYWSGIPIGLQSAKNAINVGWLDLNEIWWIGSSVGPTFDGRIKPELMAKGAQLFGADLDHGYHNRWGSSGSAPTTAGAIALLYEWFFNEYGVYPNAALTKAIMCNTAFDLFYTGPDYFLGFGRVNAWRALESFRDTSFIEDNITDAAVKTYMITVPPGVSQLNVLAAWSDKEAVPGAIKTLVNDIDIKVTGPGPTEYFPWILDPANPVNPATTGIDKINNIEKVSVFNPAAGTYTIEVSGTDIPFGPQDFALTYDLLETGIKITNPVGGEKWVPETQYIRWDAFGTGDNFAIDISYDDGSTWTNLGNTTSSLFFPSTFFSWTVKDTTTHVARMRVSSGGFESISGPFTIMDGVTGLFESACDQHLPIAWREVQDADDYIVQILEGNEYVPIDTTMDTTYVISGLQNGMEYWVAVTARDGSNKTLRSNGQRLVPNGGDCSFTDDIGAYALCHPMGFRYTFDGSLPYNESLQVVVRNYSSNAISGFDVCYEREGSGPVCEAYPGTLAASGIDTFTFAAVESFTDTLNYPFKIYTTYASDSRTENDTLWTVVKVVPSYPMPLPYYNGFEDPPVRDYISKQFAIDGMRDWDFEAGSAFGRMSVSRLEQFADEGMGSITLDRYQDGGLQNSCAILNLNLDAYVDSTIYLDLSYVDHDEEAQDGDKIWARASDSDPWAVVYDFGANLTNSQYKTLNAINLTQILIVENGQVFSDRFQLKLGQEGNEDAFYIDRDDGRSFDNIRLYTVGTDVAIAGIDLQPYYCDSTNGSIPVTVVVENNSSQDAVNVPVTLDADNGTVLTDTIPFIMAGSNVFHTFSAGLPYAPGDVIEVGLYVSYAPDQYAENDSLNNLEIVIQPFAGMDFFDNFEGPDFGFHATGQNSTWERGMPDNVKISEAASGTTAWVTNLTGRHNNSEQSYLVSPCFDFSDFGANPNFAFNLKLDIVTNDDFMSMEYSEDGVIWNRLSDQPESYNWFNDAGAGEHWDIDIPEWTTTSNNLDLTGLSALDRVIFRVVLSTGPSNKVEGIGIDDVNVMEDVGAVFDLASGQEFTQPSLAVGPAFTNWTESGEIVAAVKSTTGSGSTLAGVAKEASFIDVAGFRAQPRHFWIEEDYDYTVRLYLPYDEYDDFYGEFGDWQAPFRMSVLEYKGPEIDGDPVNNVSNYRCVPNVLIKPYRNGYILEFEHSGPAEFYIVENTPCSTVEFVDASGIIATGLDPVNGSVSWTSEVEINMAGYVVEAGIDTASYDSIAFIAPMGSDTMSVDYQYIDSVTEKSCIMCYRVRAILDSGESIFVGEDTASFIFPSLVEIDSLDAEVEMNDDVTVQWGTTSEKCNDYFEVLVSVNGGVYSSLGTVNTAGDSENWTAYSILDDSTPKMDTLCYRLDQYFIDGSMQSSGPVCVIFADTMTMDTTASILVGVMTATGLNEQDASITWNTLSEQEIAGFLIEAGPDSMSYDSIGFIVATGTDSTSADYQLIDSVTAKDCYMCYRVTAISSYGDSIAVGEDTASFIFPTRVAVDSFTAAVELNDDVTISWGTSRESCNDYFDVLVSINGAGYTSVGTVPSSGASESWTAYVLLDDSTPKMDTLCYRLDQYFIDGSMQSSGPLCVIFADTTMDTIPELAIVDILVTGADCHGASTGAIDITIEGGTPPYLIRWSNGAETEDLSGVPAGDYIVSIEDALGETLISEIIVITEPEPLSVSGGTANDVQCHGTATGSIEGVTVSGGTPPYAYLWTNGSISLDNTGLEPGSYQLTVTDSNGCSAVSAIFQIDEPLPISVLDIEVTDAACQGDSSGSIGLEIGGGVPPYDFLWSNGEMTDNISGLGAGTYSCLVTDANGCTLETSDITVGEPSAITISNVIIQDADCFGTATGSINISVAGGQPPYDYLWSSGQMTQDVSGIPAGSYSVEITDADGCTVVSVQYDIGEPEAVVLEVDEINPVSCFGGSDGSIGIEISGGTPPYFTSWDNGSFEEDISGLQAGSYTVTIIDAAGCTLVSDPIEVSEPEQLEVASLVIVDNICFGGETGAIDIEVSGGTPPYSFSWNNGSMAEDLADIGSGSYSVEITDENGCGIVLDEIEVAQPDMIIEQMVDVSDISCTGEADGAIDIEITGGTPPYSILWSNGSTDEDIESLEPDMYSYTVTDANGCTASFGPHIVAEPNALEFTLIDIKDVACRGKSTGSINIELTGGTPPYSYAWSNGDVTQDLENAADGEYTVTVTDANGCTLVSDVLAVGQPEIALEASIETTPETSAGATDGSVVVMVTGGDQPYTFEWNTGETSQNLFDVPAAEYCVNILDANGCMLDLCATVEVGTAVLDLLKINELILYPNPAGQQASLEIVLSQPSDISVRLIDIGGSVIQEQFMRSVQQETVLFNVESLAAGTYLVNIRLGGGSISLPLVVQH